MGGDFKVIISNEEKLGGLPFKLCETKDFKNCINICNLKDSGFKGLSIHSGM